MTAPLEGRYRRLLAVYPPAHRDAYEEEMVGVLMAGAQPGQRRPALGEAADLLWSGVVARFGRGLRELRGAGWRDAAAVAGLLSVVLLAALACRRLTFGLFYFAEYGDPMRFLGVDGGLLLDVAARSVAWLAVLVAVLAAARRTAVALAGVALLVEVAAIVVWLPRSEFHGIRMSWAPVLALLTVALLAVARRGRPAVTILGRRGLALIGAGLVLLSVSSVLLQSWRQMQFLGLFSTIDGLQIVAGVLLLAALWRLPVPIRRRTFVLHVPALAIPYAQHLFEDAIAIELARVVTPGMVVIDVLMLAGLPLLAFGLALAALHARENLTLSGTRKAPGVSASGGGDK